MAEKHNLVKGYTQKGNTHHFFYAFSQLSSEKYLMVIENKSLPGRAELEEGEAIGRLLTIAWFEKSHEAMDSVVVRPVEGTYVPLALDLNVDPITLS